MHVVVMVVIVVILIVVVVGCYAVVGITHGSSILVVIALVYEAILIVYYLFSSGW